MEDMLKNILFLCIGDSNIVGDSLGPLIGSFIKENKNSMRKDIEIDVIGTMEFPIGYKKINNIIAESRRNAFIIIIDSALGSVNNIGKIIIDDSSLCAGKGLNKGKFLNGDIIIRGIVGKNHNNIISNVAELRNISAKRIENIAYKIIETIIPFLSKV